MVLVDITYHDHVWKNVAWKGLLPGFELEVCDCGQVSKFAHILPGSSGCGQTECSCRYQSAHVPLTSEEKILFFRNIEAAFNTVLKASVRRVGLHVP